MVTVTTPTTAEELLKKKVHGQHPGRAWYLSVVAHRCGRCWRWTSWRKH